MTTSLKLKFLTLLITPAAVAFSAGYCVAAMSAAAEFLRRGN